MSFLLHNLLSLVMGLAILAAPVLCLCAEKPAPREQQAHQCCAANDTDPTQHEKDHSGACTHCGAQTVRLSLDQSPSLELMLPLALLPMATEIDLMLHSELVAANVASAQDPPGNPTPVQSHTCSLT